MFLLKINTKLCNYAIVNTPEFKIIKPQSFWSCSIAYFVISLSSFCKFWCGELAKFAKYCIAAGLLQFALLLSIF